MKKTYHLLTGSEYVDRRIPFPGGDIDAFRLQLSPPEAASTRVGAAVLAGLAPLLLLLPSHPSLAFLPVAILAFFLFLSLYLILFAVRVDELGVFGLSATRFHRRGHADHIGVYSKDHPLMYRVWELNPNPLDIGSHLQTDNDAVFAPTLASGWTGISLYSSRADAEAVFNEDGKLPVGTCIYAARTDELVKIQDIALFQHPAEKTHFGLAPAAPQVGRQQFLETLGLVAEMFRRID